MVLLFGVMVNEEDLVVGFARVLDYEDLPRHGSLL